MPISVPGTSSRRGFTLIEVLVVLLIMGLCVGLVGAIVRPDDRALLRVEVERLAQLLDLAAAEARLTGHAIAWTADAHDYRFWQMGLDAEWSPVRDSDLLRARALPRGMTISGLQIENMPVRGAMRLEFSPYGTTPAFNIEMSLGDARNTIAASPLGELRVLPQEGTANVGMALR